MDKIRILFLAANPKGTSKLRLDEEIREITEKIRASHHREMIDLISAWAIRPDDLIQSLNEHRPTIVHFSGHGSPDGQILLLDNKGEIKPVEKEAIKDLFTALKDNIQLILLNACYSKSQATAIKDNIDCVIGMNSSIGDQAAITFAASFYRAIGFGRSIKEAFEQGNLALSLNGIPENNIPELLCKKDVDPSEIFLLKNIDSKSNASSFHSENSFLNSLWNYFDEDMQDIISLAYNFSKRNGTNTIKTRYLFAAMRRINPKILSDIFNKLPPDSLPSAINDDVSEELLIFKENLNFSSCVRESFLNLGRDLNPDKKISSRDVFIDIAKHGKGRSVEQLRRYGINAILDQIKA